MLLCLFLACNAQNCSHQIGEWRNKLEIPQFHIEGPFIAANNKLYVFTGFQTNDLICKDTMEVFDPQQNTWTSLAATPVKVSHVQAVFDGRYVKFLRAQVTQNYYSFIWLVGGYVEIPPNHQPLATTFKYDVANDKWLEGPVLPDTRYGREINSFNVANVVIEVLLVLRLFMRTSCTTLEACTINTTTRVCITRSTCLMQVHNGNKRPMSC